MLNTIEDYQRALSESEAKCARALNELAASEVRFNTIFEDSAVLKWINDAAGNCLKMNKVFRDFIGLDLPDFVFASAVHPSDNEARNKSRQNIVKGLPYDTEFRLRDATGEYRWLTVCVAPLRSSDGSVSAWVGNATDIDDRVKAQQDVERQLEITKLLTYELNHRVRNTLTIILAMVRQTFRSAKDMKDFQKIFEGRLYGLAATHDILVAKDWRGAELDDIIAVALTPICLNRRQWRTAGDSVQLDATQTTALGIMFHELATNAIKHGALNCDEGTLEISWLLTGDGRLKIKWQETHQGNETPFGKGFGTKLIEQIGKQLLGNVQLDFHPYGLRCEADIPLKLAA